MRRLLGLVGSIYLLASSTAAAFENPNPHLALATTPPAVRVTSAASRILKSETTRTLLAGAVLTRIALHFDNPAQRDATTLSWAESDIIDAADAYGNGGYLAALSGVIWGAGALSGRDDLRGTGVAMVKGLLIDATIVTSLKMIVSRTRPDGSNSLSFPSGHSSEAFTISTILSRRHGWKLGIPAFGFATFTAISRMEDRHHYLSDVVAGAAIGVTVGQLCTPRTGPGHGGLQVTATPSSVGLRLRF